MGIVFVTFGSFPLVQNIQEKTKRKHKQNKVLPHQFIKLPNSDTDEPLTFKNVNNTNTNNNNNNE